MTRRVIFALVVTFLTLLLPGVLVIPAYASTPTQSGKPLSPFYSQINISDPGNLYEFKPISIHGSLTDWQGLGIVKAPIAVHLDGQYLNTTQTGSDGTFQMDIDQDLTLGNHTLEFFFTGTDKLDRSSASVTLPIQTNVTLTLEGSREVNLSEPIVLTGILWDLSTGTPVSDKSIKVFAQGELIGQAPTDEHGAFYLHLHKDFPEGSYQITASFNGAHRLSPAFAQTTVEILPVSVKVQTVPAVPGVSFQMDDHLFVTGEDGSVSIPVGRTGEYKLTVLLDQYYDPSTQVEFGRWTEESYEPTRDVNVPNDKLVQVGLDLFHKVSLKFIDLDGFPIDPARIESVSIRSTQGDNFTFNAGDSLWLPASRTARRHDGLEKTDLLYSVNSVTIDGSNVVNSAQQRFFVKPDDIWNISLLLYSMHITSRDGLLASPVGKTVDLVYPNGEIKSYTLDKTGQLEIHALARGIYHVTLPGIKGMGTSIPVALSRNQEVKLTVVTIADIAVAGAIALMFAFGLILYGRPWLVHFLLRRKKSPTSQMEWTSQHDS